ncbi:hypothetical protein [Haloglomus salinum]|uniref:hypothetical protein n=1 Tax=Haloglomus salinum TaxID=2962673 RepID=UPI0020C9A3D9|nr:hypothetical protein [Haloglomus salinum]
MSVEQYVLDEVERRTDPVAEGKTNAHGPLWTSADGIRQDGDGEGSPWSPDHIRAAVQQLVDEDRLFGWHGLLAPATEEHLRAIVQREAQQDVTRTLLVAKANQRIAEISGEEEDGD